MSDTDGRLRQHSNEDGGGYLVFVRVVVRVDVMTKPYRRGFKDAMPMAESKNKGRIKAPFLIFYLRATPCKPGEN
ncbi:hypothetical protein Astex_2002 [Asticcacaulis excentricus CB 48]|uniref:Uncharacterized protein n=1 Tax=Asticcacaulis excentricus (strain ATCC 15261 / DSM 4724 / KCTC 12464 / NCIMB 9791 / VKM B-1370 / CB 48) TaxID=573065 RepID=E8RL51_ASTEC|nr:hypothetical protein Astex_2002 [Asticcacaulis excentricus CB 48]